MIVGGRAAEAAAAAAAVVELKLQQVDRLPGGQPAVVGSAWAPGGEEPLRLSLVLPIPQLTLTPTLPA